jgi:hypothetical protein
MAEEQPVFNLSNLQAEFVQSKSRFCCAITGVGLGKTFMLLVKAWKHCENHKNALCLVIRKEFTDLQDSTIRDFGNYFGVKLDGKNNYTFGNGSVMMFRHGNENDLAVLKNVNLSFIGIEQGEEYENNVVFTWGRDRLRRKGTQTNQIAMICNSNGMDWVYDMFIKNATFTKDWSVDKTVLGKVVSTDEVYYSRAVVITDENGDDLEQKYECWTANSWLNAENLPRETLLDWQTQEVDAPNHFRRMILNKFDAFDDVDMVFTSENIQTALNVEFLYTRVNYDGLIMGVDVARGGDMCVTAFLRQVGPNHWEEEYYESWREKDTTASVGRILELKGKHNPSMMIVDGDGLGGPMIDQIRNVGIDCVEYRGGKVKDGYDNTRYANKTTQDAFNMKMLIEGNRLRVHKDIIPDMQLIKFTEGANRVKQLVPKDKLPRSPDHFDAVKMACSLVDDPAIHIQTTRSTQPRTAKAIEPFKWI